MASQHKELVLSPVRISNTETSRHIIVPFCNCISLDLDMLLQLHLLFHCCLIKICFMFQGTLFIGDDDSNVALALFTNMILVFS